MAKRSYYLKMNKIIVIFLLFLAMGCAQKNVEAVKPITMDLKQLISFDEALRDESTIKSPALYEYSFQGKKLWYLAANHTNDPKSETFQLIKYVFDNQPVQAVIIEGFETTSGESPKNIKEMMLKGQTKDFYTNGEASYVIEMAVKNGVPFFGGEPNDKEIYSSIKKQGYEAIDLIGFNFVRRLPQLRRQGKVKDMRNLQSEFEWYAESKALDFGIENFSFSFKDFEKWYRLKQGKKLSIDAGQNGETAPMSGPYFTQTISKVITTARDENILNAIAATMNKYQNVLIVYGSSHYRIEYKAIEKSLGSPKELFMNISK